MDDPEVLDSLFCEAVSAFDAGDVTTLERLLAAHPRLVRDRLETPGAWLRDKVGGALDGFFKQPYLLWFVAEDPVRTGMMPRNIAQVTRAIVQAAQREGVDTLPEQLRFALHLAVCSPVGREDGLQRELIDALIDAGASADGATLDCLVCCNLAASEQLLERGAGLTLPTALCLGRWDDVSQLAQTAGAEEKEIALAAAALNGKAQALATLIDLGVDLNAYSSGFYTHATPLHRAVCSGSLDAVQVLVEAGSELGTKDRAWNATPLGWAMHYQQAKKGEEDAKRHAEIAAYLREKESQR
jgi:peptide-methionine (S)-S-oxide reductase